MNDLIDRQAAMEALDAYIKVNRAPMHYENQFWVEGMEDAERIIKELPSAQPTLYGYKIEHLAMIARVMKKEGVSPEKAVEIFQDIGAVVQMIVDEQKQILRKAVEEWI